MQHTGMVHALRETQRVLRHDGLLIDLRPLADGWPIEIASSAEEREVGRATDLAQALADDAAANAAMADAEGSGQWVRELQEEFSLFYYWDTPSEMQEYLDTEWDDVIAVEEAVWQQLRTAWASANSDARPRVRMKMLITRYRRARTNP